jgi:hypothetical protein
MLHKSILLLLVLALAACTTKQTLSADLPVVSFQSDIQPIMSANCAVGSRCHSGSGGHLESLLTYTGVMRYVTAGDAHGSPLYSTVRLYYGNVMPPSPNPHLSDDQIAKIYVWINQGAQNN